MKKLIWILLCSICWAQQPSTGGDSTHYPLWGANSKWSNGVAVGYYPTKGSGLTLNIGAGTANCLGTRVAYAGSTLTMSNNATNYVFLDSTSSCAPASNTTGYPSLYWIATVVTSGGSISSVTDDRTTFFAGGHILKVNASAIPFTDIVNFNDTTPTAASNGLNVKWQKSSSGGTTSVSAYVPGDGIGTHCLLGTGAFGTCLVAVGGSPGDIQYNNGGVLGGFSDGTIDQVLHGTKVFKSIPNCLDSSGNHLNYSTSTHTWSCGTSSSGGAGGGFLGVLTKTANYTFASSDSGYLIVMNCSSSCTLTFNGSPGSTDWGWIMSIGSTTATISLNSKNFNGASSVPVFNKFEIIPYFSDGSNYFGNPPLARSGPVTITPTSNARTIGATVTTSDLPTATIYRVCMLNRGADNGAVLIDADLGPQKRRCFIPAAAHIVEITVSADTGTPSVLLQRRRGASTVADLLSGALATAASGAVACARSGTSATCIDGTTSSGSITTSNTALSAGDYIEFKSGTAGGAAHSFQVAVTMTID